MLKAIVNHISHHLVTLVTFKDELKLSHIFIQFEHAYTKDKKEIRNVCMCCLVKFLAMATARGPSKDGHKLSRFYLRILPFTTHNEGQIIKIFTDMLI